MKIKFFSFLILFYYLGTRESHYNCCKENVDTKHLCQVVFLFMPYIATIFSIWEFLGYSYGSNDPGIPSERLQFAYKSWITQLQ